MTSSKNRTKHDANQKTILPIIAIISITAITATLNITIITEHYGAGPPHYDRTTNMDKWSNPAPTLIIINTIALAMLTGIVWRCKKTFASFGRFTLKRRNHGTGKN